MTRTAHRIISLHGNFNNINSLINSDATGGLLRGVQASPLKGDRERKRPPEGRSPYGQDSARAKRVAILTVIFLSLAMHYGCASLPRQPIGRAFTLKGRRYLSLPSLCEKERINWQWDSFANVVTLQKNNMEMKLLVGSEIALLNGRIERLKRPVEFYKGMVVVPLSFIDTLRDSFLKQPGRVFASRGYYRLSKIVLDPGHGGRDPGAIGNSGLKEKDVTLDITRRLKGELEAKGIKVVLTRDKDEFVSLWKRAQIANRERGDFFISIHTNASPSRNRRPYGFEAYYLSLETDDSTRALAAAEDSALASEKASLEKNPSTTLKAIIWDLILSENRREAIELASFICKAVSRQLGVRIRGVKGGPFYVLKKTRIPAILLEVSFLSNPREEGRLKNRFYRQLIAESIAQGVLNYRQKYEGDAIVAK